jgi:hypothetical protein
VLQIHRIAPRIKVHLSDPSEDRSIKNVRQLESIFEPYRTMFMEMKEERSRSYHNVSAKKTVKYIRILD